MNSKPTGEWTAEYVRDLQQSRGYITSETGWKAVADAHNAALGGERQKVDGLPARVVANTNRLENALVFADKTISGLHRIITGHTDQIHQLEQQLAAELERADKAAVRAELAQIALAAEREKIRHVVALLENPKFDDWDRRELLKALHLTGAER